MYTHTHISIYKWLLINWIFSQTRRIINKENRPYIITYNPTPSNIALYSCVGQVSNGEAEHKVHVEE